jgi:uncharacterized protein
MQTHSNITTIAAELGNTFLAQSCAIIAYNGGVDSALMAYMAHRALGQKMTAVIADSPSLARQELDAARQFTKKHGIPLKIVLTAEMENPGYRANDRDRCYYCKQALFIALNQVNREISQELCLH